MCRAKFLAVTFVLVAFVRHTECWSRRRRSPPPCTPRDCQVSLWSTWSACTQQCGTSGTQIRTRTVTVPATCGGSCPFALSETRPCNRDNCQNSGTPIANGCLCQAGFTGTCCEIGKVKKQLAALERQKHNNATFSVYGLAHMPSVKFFVVPVFCCLFHFFRSIQLSRVFPGIFHDTSNRPHCGLWPMANRSKCYTVCENM